MLVFCYGVLLNQRVWREFEELRLEPKFVCRALLDDYTFVFDGQSRRRSGATANILKARGSYVWGALFEISERDLKVLDLYEAVPEVYERKQVAVTDDSGGPHIAWVYCRIAQDKGCPGAEYLAKILEGAKDCGLPQNYISKLQKTTTC